jgi:hypothetical protein
MRAHHDQLNESVPWGARPGRALSHDPLPGAGRVRVFSGRMALGLAVVGIALFPTLVAAVAGTRAASAAQATVDLGTATPFSVLAGAGVTNTGPTVLGGDLGTCPTPAITGFPPGVANGTTHANDAVACQAQSDLTIAYDDAAGRAPTTSFTGPTDLGGLTLTTGVYTSPVSFAITGPLTLDAQLNPDAVFIFQAGSTLITATDSSVDLVNGAQACNVFWQVGSSSTLGVDSTLAGTVMALASITADHNATVDGRLLARIGAVTLDSNTVTAPACATGASSSSTPTTSPPSTTTPTTATSSTTSPSSSSTTSSTSPSSSSTTSSTAPASSSTTSSSTSPASSSSTTTMLPGLSTSTTTAAQAATTTAPVTTRTATAGALGAVTTTTGPGPDVPGEVVTKAGTSLPRTGAPIGATALLAVITLMLGMGAIRFGRVKPAPRR